MNASLSSVADYPFVAKVPLRWTDNDLRNHLGHVAYATFAQDLVARFATEVLGVDWTSQAGFPVAVNFNCDILQPFGYPGELVAGAGIVRLGTRSLTYEVVFATPKNLRLFTCGASMTHVFVAARGSPAVEVPAHIRAMAEGLLVAGEA